MLGINDAYIEVDTSDTGAGIDFTIPWSDIEAVDFSRKINRLKDDGSIVLHNDTGVYSEGDKELTLGDRLDVYVSVPGSVYDLGDDDTGWGYGGWGGDLLVWSALVEDISYVRASPNESDIVIDGTDYVFGTMSNRIVFDHFEDQDITGHDDAIVETVMSRLAPEINLDHVADVGERTGISADGIDLLEFMISLQRRANARMTGYRDRLVFTPVQSIDSKFVVDDDDIGGFEHTYLGSTVANSIRIDGGTGSQIDDEQTTQDAYERITSTDRLTFQVSTRKSSLRKIEIWTRKTGSGDSVRVRLQKDDGGAPVAVDDASSDVDSKQLSYEFISRDDFTTFLLNDHTLPEPDPWVILETDGETGQDIGVSNGTPAYKAWYPFPISIRMRDEQSIRQHGRIERSINRGNIATLDEAREAAEEIIDHEAEPESEFEFPALSRRMLKVEPGGVVEFDMSREKAVGDFMVTETTSTLENNTMYKQLKARHVDTI